MGGFKQSYKAGGKGIRKWWIMILCLVILTVVVFTALRYSGMIVNTIVEREVFKNSFQYKEARISEISTYSAQLIEINTKLSMSDLDDNTRANMKAQAASIRILLATARRRIR